MRYPDLRSNFEEDFQPGGVVACDAADTEFDYRMSAYLDSPASLFRCLPCECEPNSVDPDSLHFVFLRLLRGPSALCRLRIGIGAGLDTVAL